MSYKDKSNHAGKAVAKTAIYEGMAAEDRNEIHAALVAFQIAREAKRKDYAPLLSEHYVRNIETLFTTQSSEILT